jgi:lipopolysaccharide/colanic/teichoic acid biosynthesis glycosyltransferase
VIKRLFDIIVSVIGLLVLSPVIFFIAFLIHRKLGSPIFFYQVRPGKNAKPFQMIKFRTMREDIDQYGRLLPDSERIVPLGGFLRNSSLDEIPELWNVLKGDMSLVGPRPLLMDYLPLYSTDQARRHNVLPGVTGWAQVNGRNTLTWEEKFEYDIWYLENQSFWLDMKIILITIKKVIAREGISANGESTMPKFTGKKG